MYIHKVHLKNIRSFEDTTIELEPKAGWHVILGDNGSGKSTLIRSIALALIGEPEIHQLGFKQNWNNWLRYTAEKGDILLSTEDEQQTSISFQKKGNAVRVSASEQELPIFSASYGSFRRLTGGSEEYHNVWANSQKLAAHLSVFGEDVALDQAMEWVKNANTSHISTEIIELFEKFEKLKLFELFEKLKSIEIIELFEKFEKLKLIEKLKLFEKIELFEKFEKFEKIELFDIFLIIEKIKSLKKIEVIKKLKKNEKIEKFELFELIKKNEELKKIEIHNTREVLHMLYAYKKQRKSATVKDFLNQSKLVEKFSISSNYTFQDTRYTDFFLTIDNLSDGYKSILALVFELLRQLLAFHREDLSAVFDIQKDSITVKAAGVVLIDEVAAHLHPSWQARIGNWFTKYFPNIQFIVSTHSPIICRSAQQGSIQKVIFKDGATVMNKIEGQEKQALVYGNILEAFETNLFGENIIRSPDSLKKLERLAALKVRKQFGQVLSPEDETELEQLSQLFPPNDKNPFA